jgi:hypothetical protein
VSRHPPKDRIIRGTVAARITSRNAPKSFSFTTRFVVEEPPTDAERAAADEKWRALIGEAAAVKGA